MLSAIDSSQPALLRLRKARILSRRRSYSARYNCMQLRYLQVADLRRPCAHTATNLCAVGTQHARSPQAPHKTAGNTTVQPRRSQSASESAQAPAGAQSVCQQPVQTAQALWTACVGSASSLAAATLWTQSTTAAAASRWLCRQCILQRSAQAADAKFVRAGKAACPGSAPQDVSNTHRDKQAWCKHLVQAVLTWDPAPPTQSTRQARQQTKPRRFQARTLIQRHAGLECRLAQVQAAQA
jgi:hypothetical protein